MFLVKFAFVLLSSAHAGRRPRSVQPELQNCGLLRECSTGANGPFCTLDSICDPDLEDNCKYSCANPKKTENLETIGEIENLEKIGEIENLEKMGEIENLEKIGNIENLEKIGKIENLEKIGEIENREDDEKRDQIPSVQCFIEDGYQKVLASFPPISTAFSKIDDREYRLYPKSFKA